MDTIIVEFPEPVWRPLRDSELTYFKRFVDQTAWQLLVSYWGITEVYPTNHYGRTLYYEKELVYERQPMYPHYNRKAIREVIKQQKGKGNGKG